MEYIGIFEAKTRFPGLCDQVVRSGIPVTVQRRGQPLVVISPAVEEASAGERGILDAWSAWSREHAEKDDSDFPEVWKFREDLRHHPLED